MNCVIAWILTCLDWVVFVIFVCLVFEKIHIYICHGFLNCLIFKTVLSWRFKSSFVISHMNKLQFHIFCFFYIFFVLILFLFIVPNIHCFILFITFNLFVSIFLAFFAFGFYFFCFFFIFDITCLTTFCLTLFFFFWWVFASMYFFLFVCIFIFFLFEIFCFFVFFELWFTVFIPCVVFLTFHRCLCWLFLLNNRLILVCVYTYFMNFVCFCCCFCCFYFVLLKIFPCIVLFFFENFHYVTFILSFFLILCVKLIFICLLKLVKCLFSFVRLN